MSGPPRTGSPPPVAPPLRLPGEHFAGALAFLLAGASALVLLAPGLAEGHYLSPRLAAATHLFTLGWITTSILGALYQFLPVALQQPIAWQRAAHIGFLLYVPGLAGLVAGLAFGRPPLLLVGAAALAAGLLIFNVNLAVTLARAARRGLTWWALVLADGYLAVTLVLGVALTGNLRWGYLAAERTLSMGVHLHVAIAGWVLLVMVGVAHRLQPMFLLSHGAGERFARLAVWLLASGAGALTVLHHAPPLLSRWVPAVLIGLGWTSFLLQAAAFYAKRHRPALDPGMRLAAAALAQLAFSLAVAVPALLGIGPARLQVAYVVAALSGITLFVAAYYYKILPFLIWFHRFGPQAGRGPVPLVTDLYSTSFAALTGTVLTGGAVGLTVSIILGSQVLARAAAALLAAGAAALAVQMLLVGRRRP